MGNRGGPPYGGVRDRVDLRGSKKRSLILQICLCEIMPMAHGMCPPVLLPSRMASGAGRNVAARHPLDVFPDHLDDRVFRAGVVGLVRADDRWGTHTPDFSIGAVFSPPCFIGVHRRIYAGWACNRVFVGFTPVAQTCDTWQKSPI